MGKVLVVPNSDFSENAVKTINLNPTLIWGIDDRSYEGSARTASDASVAPFVPDAYASLQDKTVRIIRLVPKVAGSVSVLLGTALGQNATVVDTLTITSEMVTSGVAVDFEVNIRVNDKILMIGNAGDTGCFAFYNPIVTGPANFYMNATKNTYSKPTGSQKLCVSFAYYG